MTPAFTLSSSLLLALFPTSALTDIGFSWAVITSAVSESKRGLSTFTAHSGILMLMDILAFQLVAIDFSKVYLMLHVSFKEALGSSADCGKQARCALSKDVATHSSLCSPRSHMAQS